MINEGLIITVSLKIGKLINMHEGISMSHLFTSHAELSCQLLYVRVTVCNISSSKIVKSLQVFIGKLVRETILTTWTSGSYILL